MKVKFLSVAIVAGSVAFTSCDKNVTTVQNNDAPVRFTSGINATPGSRATIDTDGNSLWETGDPVGIYMVGNGTTIVTEGNANMKYTAAQDGASTAFTAVGASIHYPLDEAQKVDFIAYHPHSEAVANFVYPIDLSTQTPQTGIDLMTARADKSGQGYTKADGRTGGVVNLTFNHQLAKLVVNVTKDASVSGNITSVSITGMNTTANFDLKGDEGITSAGSPAAITPCTITAEEKYEAILLPVALLTDAHTMTFITDGGETYTWKMYEQISELEAGKIYTYAINVTKYAVTANGSINNWVTGSIGNGTAE